MSQQAAEELNLLASPAQLCFTESQPVSTHSHNPDATLLAPNAMTGLDSECVELTQLIEGERTHHRTAEPLEFERLVANLLIQFINLPIDQFDAVIRDAFRNIGEALDLDRCNFFQLLSNGLLLDPINWERTEFQTPPAPFRADLRFPWALETLRSGEVVQFSSVDEIPHPIDRETYQSLGVRSTLTVPLSVAGRVLGAVNFSMLRKERVWLPDDVRRLRSLAVLFGNVLARRESDSALQQTFEELKRLRDRLHAENLYLRTEVHERIGHGAIVGQSAAIRAVLSQVEHVAPTDSTVLLLGETGTGKELFATKIHQLSGRHGRPMVRVNCSAIPATLMENELFGSEKGAFTGALARQIGRFELANHSTIFLDEIGDLPLEIQVKLLRVLEERQIERLGSPKPIDVDTRIIAATHRDLERRVAEGTFREDLYYRLNVFPIEIPPLRRRVDDIPLLIWRFVEEFAQKFGKRIDAIPRANLAALESYGWPGNVRELRNLVERAMIVATGPHLTIPLPASPTVTTVAHSERLFDVQAEHIRRVLDATGWRIRGAAGAAERLGLRPTTLETRMVKLGLRRPTSRQLPDVSSKLP